MSEILATPVPSAASPAARRVQLPPEHLAPSTRSLPFADPVLEASQDDRSRGWLLSAGLMVALLMCLSVWAYYAVIEQVASGPGRAIAAQREQVIQSLEGGILAEMLVREGDHVNAGDPLVRLDPIRAKSSFREGRSKLLALKATAARLLAEANDRSVVDFDDDVRADKALVARELSTFEARRQTMQQVVSSQRRTRDLLQREIAITEPMVNQGLVAEVELLRLKRQSSEIDGQVAERLNRFKSEAYSEFIKVMGEISQVSEVLVAKQDQVERTLVKAPIRGTVKNIRITTRGGVIQPGQDILEIAPTGDNLLVEAKIRPSDIAFMQVGQNATVKISAYDPQIYGSLQGKVQFISPDTLLEERSQQQETYYKVIVRTDTAVLHHNGKELPVLPGMTATVDIKTGTTTVANSLLKPVLRLKDALRER
ncbi:MAG: HlyD family efflux transporter periplasmic adaptor subunit [Hydrogenophaga sp.]|uniref:HlyD family efflux transporter periplasmic adaptor subunit n=1 Tax=Hydrogenophaga sp. TaxID=1904254 RepID=UPI003D09E14F